MKKIFSALLSLVVAICSIIMLPACKAEATPQTMEITAMKVNSLTKPIGIDTNPIFSWTLTSDGFGKSQSAYRIIVSTTMAKAEKGEGDMWDSGKIAGENNYDIAYDGQPLSSRTEYFWRVDVYDESDNLSESEISTFETGMLSESDWQAQWIDAGIEEIINFDDARWIWNDEAQYWVPAGVKYFRFSFTPDESKTIETVYIACTGDDHINAYLNGEEIGSSTIWTDGIIVNATDKILSGKNVLSARVENTTGGTGAYAAYVAKLQVHYTDGTFDAYASNDSWKLSETEVEGWTNVDFDDSSWKNATDVGAITVSPWKNVEVDTSKISEATGAPMLRKEFNVAKDVKKARMYISGLGLFELLINGNLPDDTVLNPANTQYEDTVHYRVFDVTDMLVSGNNAIAVELGNYFYNENYSRWNTKNAVWRDQPKLIAQLHITYSDGTEDVIKTDTSWKVTTDGPRVFDSVYFGEYYDARKEITGWDKAGFDDSSWDNAALAKEPGKLVFEDMEPMRRLTTFKSTVSKIASGSYVIEIPVITAGWAKINFPTTVKDEEITIVFGETLKSDGSVHPVSWGDGAGSFQTYKYTCKGNGNETFEPKFSYAGFQYIEVKGYSGTLTAKDVECYLIASDVESSSTIETSNELINTLHEMMVRSTINNMQGKPTDCPTWEKLGWLGDYDTVVRSVMFNYDASAFNRNFMDIIRDAAKGEKLPNFAPVAEAFGNVVIWNAAYIDAIYEAWNYYGSLTLAEDHYDKMREVALSYIKILDKNDGVWPHTGSLNDWQGPDGPSSSPEGSGIIGTAYVYGTLGNLAEMADALGKTEEAAEYRAYRKNIYTAFNNKFYNAEKGYYETGYWNSSWAGTRSEYRQTSNLVPIAFGLCPEENLKSVVDSIANHVISEDYHLESGHVGTKLILPVLSENGYEDIAYKLITQTTYPSWGYWVSQGATTLWEGYPVQGTRSRDHYFLGSYDQWIFENLAGIDSFNDGFKNITIKPQFIGDLTYVNCSLDTVRGKLVSNWEKSDDNKVSLTVTIPVGSKATVILPSAELLVNDVALNMQAGIDSFSTYENETTVVLNSGTYTFTFTEENGAITKEGNLAIGATIEAYGTITSPARWTDPAKLIDGDRDNIVNGEHTGWSCAKWTKNSYVLIDLGDIYNVNSIEIYPTGQNATSNLCSNFPKGYDVLISEDNVTWTTVDSRKNLEVPVADENNNSPVFVSSFNKQKARYVKVNITAYHDTYGQFAEIEVYYRATDKDKLKALINTCNKLNSSDYTVSAFESFSKILNEAKFSSDYTTALEKLTSAYESLKNYTVINLAADKTVTASSTIGSAPWNNPQALTDGDRNNFSKSQRQGWSGDYGATPTIDIDLEEIKTISYVDLYPTGSTGANTICRWFPKNYSIQVSTDNSTWKTVYSVKNAPQPYSDENDNITPVSHQFAPVQARYVRVNVTKLNDKYTTPWNSIEKYVQFSEIEVYAHKNAIVGATLQIGSSLTVNYYADITGNVENALMRFTRNKNVVEIKGVFDESSGYFVFDYAGINPQCMNDFIKAELVIDGKTVSVKENYSVKSYCENLITKTADELTLTQSAHDALKTLLADMLVYGAASQEYKQYNLENLPDTSKWVSQYKSEFTVPEGVKTIIGNTDENNMIASAGVNMSNVNKVYFKIKVTDDVIIKLNDVVIDKSALTKNSNGTYTLYSEGIKATQFDKVFTLQLIKDGNEISRIQYNTNAYIQTKYATPSVEKIVKALSNYGNSAIKYKTAISPDNTFEFEGDNI